MCFKKDKANFMLGSLALLVAVSHGQLRAEPEGESEAEKKGTVCVEVDKEIYSSESTDIKTFKETRPDLRQISRQRLKNEKNVTLYIFTPGNIFCAVKKAD